MYLFEDSNKLFLKSSLCEFACDCVVGQIIDSANLSFTISEDPHEWTVFIIKYDCIWNIDFEFEFMIFITGSEC